MMGERMTRVHIPSSGPTAWQAFLAKPDLHWQTGYSAKTLAHCWEGADGLPPEIARMFDAPAELLLALPEYKVPLPGGTTQSQNDVFALVRHADQTCAAMIEGKVNEPFDKTVAEWLGTPSEGKQMRLSHICQLLGLDPEQPPLHLCYQLLHRTASALIEARRFKTDEAAMIIHSFSPKRLRFDDFAALLNVFGLSAEPDTAVSTTLPSGQRLRLGWASGDPRFLAM
ncbi:hypothetical protein G6N73_00975 [Mesorhizobium camelthorni]|uniref:DUF6946 domain-containing protein n=2 Tax=Allomesorhizobium camelthorni TaxID=475069 RepID=A0A6G4W584_9HYPH|nr:hypothetical protein [Mesorhizobium camelthorni]